MSVAEKNPAVDLILLKVLEAAPFQLTTDGGVEESRRRFRDLPRREVHPEVRSEDRTIDGPAGPIPMRVYLPPANDDGARYAELLAAAGVRVELPNAQTLIHGYVGYSGVVPAATEATERGLSALRRALECT